MKTIQRLVLTSTLASVACLAGVARADHTFVTADDAAHQLLDSLIRFDHLARRSGDPSITHLSRVAVHQGEALHERLLRGPCDVARSHEYVALRNTLRLAGRLVTRARTCGSSYGGYGVAYGYGGPSRLTIAWQQVMRDLQFFESVALGSGSTYQPYDGPRGGRYRTAPPVAPHVGGAHPHSRFHSSGNGISFQFDAHSALRRLFQ